MKRHSGAVTNRGRLLNALSTFLCLCIGFNAGCGGGSNSIQAGVNPVGRPSAPPTTIANHVLTWAYDQFGEHGSVATAAQVQAFVSFAEDVKRTNSPPGKAETDCFPRAGNVGCQAVAYIQATRLHVSGVYPQQFFIAQLNADAIPNDGGFFHNSKQISSDRVSDSSQCLKTSSTCLFANVSNQSVINFVNQCIIQGGSGSGCDGQSFTGYAPGTEFFEDTASPVCLNATGFGVYFPPQATSQTPIELGSEPTCDSKLQADLNTFLSGLHFADGTPARLFLNNYAPLCTTHPCYFPGTALTFWTKATVPAAGIVDEGSVCGANAPPHIGHPGPNALDDMAELFNEAATGDYVSLFQGMSSATTSQLLQTRRYCTGIFWLGYNPGRSVLWENIATTSGSVVLNIYPEAQIVPMNPLTTMPDIPNASAFGSNNGTGCTSSGNDDTSMQGGVKALLVSHQCGSDGQGNFSGIYVREFRNCYSWGRLVGAGQCAVVVNTTNATATIGGSASNPWTLTNGNKALSQSYNEMLVLSGQDVVTDNCSPATGCATGTGTDLNFGGAFQLYSTSVNSGDAAFLFHS